VSPLTNFTSIDLQINFFRPLGKNNESLCL